MARNTILNLGAGGDIIATEDFGTYKIQRVKLSFGVVDVGDINVSATNPLPVTITTALPAGTNIIGALVANQTIDINKVGSGAISLGQKTMANSFPIAIASDQSTLNVLLATGANIIGSLALHQSANIDQIGGATFALGQTTTALSLPVTMASNQGALASNISQVGGAVIGLGQNTMANSFPVAIASNQSNLNVVIQAGANIIGSLVANQSINLAQFGGTGITIGQHVMGTSIPVALASDQSALAVSQNGNWTTRIVGSSGAVLDASAAQNIAAPASGLFILAQFNTVPTAITNGNVSPIQMDSAANILVNLKTALPTGANVIGALTANQSVNVNQIGGGAVITVAAGVQKVGISDSAGNAFLSAANALNSIGTGIQAIQIAGQFDDVAPTAITENQFGNLRMSANRNLYGTIRDAAGNERGANISAQSALFIEGAIANAVADAGNPVKVGGVARTANPTAVTNGQRVDMAFDKLGRQLVVIGQVRDLIGTQFTQITTVTETTIFTAGGAGIFNDIIALVITNENTSTVVITIRDATAGTIRHVISLGASGGIVMMLPRSWPQTAANNNWTATLSAARTLDFFVMVEKNI